MPIPEPFERDRAELAEKLRQLRAASGLSGVAAAERLGWSQSKVSKVETARVTPSVRDVALLLEAFQAPAEDRRTLEAKAVTLNERYESMRMLRKRGVHRLQKDLRLRAEETEVRRTFQPTMVPGLLQSAEYARAVFEQPLSMAGTDVDEAVQARAARQSVLFDTRRHFFFVLTEAALRHRMGSPETMTGQMDRIANLSTLKNIRIGVLPWRSLIPHVPLNAFTIDDEREVAIENFTTHRTITDPRDIDFHLKMFQLFADAAVYDDEARDFLARLAREHSS